MSDGRPDCLSFDAFYRRWHRDLVRLAHSLTGSSADADDIAGAALSAAWENWERVRTAAHPFAYVRRIVVNMAADQVHRTARERQRKNLLGPMVAWFHHGPDVAAVVDLRAALLLLPAGQRACVVLRHLAGLTPEDTARALGISPGTVKSQTSKGLAQLRALLTEPADGGRGQLFRG
ncbi:SigE family RNA polymerase sigma factor [Winogradskya consettensis]|uniref:RNA polymerase sigma factor n=1 Tax=Winogradskya consettensis TaxID=113560 RepID=A0A919SQA6_9ACTN|nr:SigE family RNA polymerase sigma factor [Actinoplanes consettensis]GIM76426.1 RNA polymerase sigma factor [Actinoplanes consettensis]